MQTWTKDDWSALGGRQLAEHAFQSGLVFSMLADKTPPGRGLWPKGFPGIEAGPRPVRPVSGRGADRRARAR